MTLEELSKIIENYYAKDKVEKTLSLLQELRSGKYYPASKIRNLLITDYKTLIASLNDDEFKIIKSFLIKEIKNLISERNDRKISYALLSEIVQFSCQKDFDIYFEYEKELFKLSNKQKDQYLYHVITLAQTRKKLIGDISNIEDFFIKKYLKLSRIKTINFKYLTDFANNVDNVNKRKFLSHLFRCKPFRNDFIIKSFILQHEELIKLGTLI